MMLKIGELASKTDVSHHTLRFYERQGLIAPAGRSDSGYRLYSDLDVDRVGFILSAKKVGFTLLEIQQLLELEITKDDKSCGDVKCFVDKKISAVNQRMLEMKRIKKSLQALSKACCGGSVPATQCTILEALSEQKP